MEEKTAIAEYFSSQLSQGARFGSIATARKAIEQEFGIKVFAGS